jgi:hypothetical protein
MANANFDEQCVQLSAKEMWCANQPNPNKKEKNWRANSKKGMAKATNP